MIENDSQTHRWNPSIINVGSSIPCPVSNWKNSHIDDLIANDESQAAGFLENKTSQTCAHTNKQSITL